MTYREIYNQATERYESARVAYNADVNNDVLLDELNFAEKALDKAEDDLAESDEEREYTFTDGNGGEDTFVCSPSEVKEAWDEWINEFPWCESSETVWVHGRATDEFGKDHFFMATVEPEEPDCSSDEHMWDTPYYILGGLKENPGIQGHGGGATGTEICRHCGTYKIWDSWAQDPETGKQGLHSIEYRGPDDVSLQYVRDCLDNEK